MISFYKILAYHTAMKYIKRKLVPVYDIIIIWKHIKKRKPIQQNKQGLKKKILEKISSTLKMNSKYMI